MNYQRLIKDLRDKLIVTQTELAEMLGVSFTSVNRWENGRFAPTTKVKRKIVQMCKDNNIDLEEK